MSTSLVEKKTEPPAWVFERGLPLQGENNSKPPYALKTKLKPDEAFLSLAEHSGMVNTNLQRSSAKNPANCSPAKIECLSNSLSLSLSLSTAHSLTLIPSLCLCPIQAKSGSFGRNVELLRLLPKRGPRAFAVFRSALIATKQPHLAGLLEPGLSIEEIGGGEDAGGFQNGELSIPVQERESSFPSKRARFTELIDCSLTDGPGLLGVQSCTAQFYRVHRDKSYRMQSSPRGLAIILSNVTFGGVRDLVDREGGEIDQLVLSQLFKDLGFSILSLHNQSAEVMHGELVRFAAQPDHRSVDSCVVAVLSHGVEGAVYGSDGELLQIQDIFRLFDNDNCPQLQNKPKMFFIQACRGDQTDSGVDLQDGKERSNSPGCEQSDAGREDTLRVKLPTRSDSICGYACLKGTTALRNTRKGSWYVQALSQVLAQNAKDMHLADMLVKVSERADILTSVILP
ncbi:caspase-2-like, partial [Scyliorhinus torazame]|uniref:caspase-2-like n=1 Tax=Scyliorhinus torazame TaxID=75743 RepID=UPI003B5AD3C5